MDLEGDVMLSDVALDPSDAAADELVALYRGISGSIRTGTTTTARWSTTGASSSA